MNEVSVFRYRRGIAETQVRNGGFGMDKAKTDKVKKAVALGYEIGDEAPKIIATGRGLVAEKIIEKAKESEVPIHRDDKLAETLSKLDFGEYIPEELYGAVVEVLQYVDRIDRVKAKMDAK